MSLILAFDPGLSGAWAMIQPNGDLEIVGDMPTMGEGARRRVNAAAIAHLVTDHQVVRVVIEEVASRPGEGSSSSFRFGLSVGIVEGACLASGVPISRVTPAEWKRHFRLPGKAKGGEEASRQMAIERWPTKASDFVRKKDHGRSDAALIGLWSVETKRRPKASEHTLDCEWHHDQYDEECACGAVGGAK